MDNYQWTWGMNFWNLTGVSAAFLLFLIAFLEKAREGIMALIQI